MSAKDDVRAHVYAEIRAVGAARFPGVEGRIPNFVGAEAAAARLADTPGWAAARVLKCNPDSPQRPVRHRALKDGKIVVVAVPKLASERPFLVLDPATLPPGSLWEASSIVGADRLGRPATPEEVPRLDAIVTGCVGVTTSGARCGKGGGYSDLEFAVLVELGLVAPDVPIWTTVHDVQEVAPGAFPVEAHDITLDAWVTPTRVVACPDRPPRPTGLLWDRLDDDQLGAMPALASRRP